MGNRTKRLLTVMIEENAGTNQPPCDAGLVILSLVSAPSVAAVLLTEASKPTGSGTIRHALLCRHGSGYKAKRQEKARNSHIVRSTTSGSCAITSPGQPRHHG